MTIKEHVTCAYYCDACGTRKDGSCGSPPQGWAEMGRKTTASYDLPTGLCFCGECMRTWRLVERNMTNYAKCPPQDDRKNPWVSEP